MSPAVLHFTTAPEREVDMNRIIFPVVVLLLFAGPALSQQSLVGSYKFTGISRELDGKPEPQPENPPHGYLIITPKIYVLFFTDAGRKYGVSDTEKAALWGTMTAHAGTYRIDGKKIVMLPDTSFNEILNGTQQVRHWDLEGKRLSLSSEPRPYGRDPSKKVVSRTEWERIE
jgi:hypothetical protein